MDTLIYLKRYCIV